MESIRLSRLVRLFLIKRKYLEARTPQHALPIPLSCALILKTHGWIYARLKILIMCHTPVGT